MEEKRPQDGPDGPTAVSVDGQETGRPSRFGTSALASLANRDFRILWFGVGGHSFTLWMEMAALNWLAWELTGSAAALGLVNFFRTIPVLFLAVPAGVVADRFNKRMVLVVSHLTILGVYLALLPLLLTETLRIEHVYVLFFIRGIAISFSAPPRQALIPALVKEGQVGNAVALQQALFNATRIVAPLLFGVLWAFGEGTAVFVALTFVEIGIVVAWLALRVPAAAAREPGHPSAMGSAVDGLRYVARNHVLLLLVFFGLLSLFLFQPHSILLPVIADERFGVGKEGYAAFLTVAGIGSLLGPAVLALLGDMRAKGALLVGSLALSGLALVAFGAVPWLSAALVLMALTGFFSAIQGVVTNILILSQSDRAYHGRVVSLYLLDRGFVPIGSLIVGYLAEATSAPTAIVVLGFVLFAATVLVAAAQPRFLKAR